MHARVELDVHRPARDALLAGGGYEGIQQAEAVDLGLQVVVEERLEARHLRVHHDDILCDASAAQLSPLVGGGHGQVVHALVLQRLGNLHGTGTVGVGLDHAHQLGARLHHRAIVVQVVHHGVQVYLENCLMHALLQQLADALEAKSAGTLQQHHLVVERTEHSALHKLVDIGKEPFLPHPNLVGRCRYLWADADEAVNAALSHQRRHLLVEPIGLLAALQDVAQDECAAAPLLVGTAGHEVEGDVERLQVAVVRVVDERQSPLALFHLQAHGDRLQASHALGHLLRCQPQVEGSGGAGDAVLDAGLVDEGQVVAAFHALIYIRNVCTVDGDKHGRHAAEAAPADALALEGTAADATAHYVVVAGIDNGLGVAE